MRGPIDGRSWIELLPTDECWAVLGSTPVGRVGVIIDGAPEVFPINVVVDEGTLVFRTDPGSLLRALVQEPPVCVEVDNIDVETATGTSVLVKGQAHELVTPAERAAAAELPLELWPYGPKSHWIRVQPTEVTGRRLHRPRAQADQ